MAEESVDGINPQDQLVDEIQSRDIKNDKHSSSSSSSSDSETDSHAILHSARKNRLFGRQKPLHLVLGGGKSADIILWRNKQSSGCVFGAATVIWLLFECAAYTLLTFLCHSLILSFSLLFLWSNLASFLNMSPPEFPKITVPEELLVTVLLWVRGEINRAFTTFRDVASGKDLKKFLLVISFLWIISVVSSWCNFLTLFYLVFLMMLTVPIMYEKNEDDVDTYAEKAWMEMSKQYAVLDEKVIQKIPVINSHRDQKKH
ncbi:reticulon-like protein B5 [Mercurialis annua]|uniref:reticulon-like protein B5 n=1 Tax=Mercurialis annua TaxID=3986 RepID=UPI002160E10D|nr:reticulon-like protein B5 [Mercurialis annua]